jgi:hypothetical protein
MLGLPRQLLAILPPLFGLLACSSEGEFTTDVAGNYTVALTNGANSCPFDMWIVGDSADAPIVIAQDGNSLHGSVGGFASLYLIGLLGSAEFEGSIQGDQLELSNFGTRSTNSGSCAYTYKATIQAKQTGDSIAGSITYSTQTNGSPDCAAIECSGTQKLSGSRPPK